LLKDNWTILFAVVTILFFWLHSSKIWCVWYVIKISSAQNLLDSSTISWDKSLRRIGDLLISLILFIFLLLLSNKSIFIINNVIIKDVNIDYILVVAINVEDIIVANINIVVRFLISRIWFAISFWSSSLIFFSIISLIVIVVFKLWLLMSIIARRLNRKEGKVTYAF